MATRSQHLHVLVTTFLIRHFVEMGLACSRSFKAVKRILNSIGNLSGRVYLGDLDVDGQLILRGC